ncbi:MAG: 5-formyltetrahydrofolate cyclo-ligase [Thermofilaceae archaeon]
MEENTRREKQEIRERIWRLLREQGVARPPFPIEGRIPNFSGAELAAGRLASSDIFRKANVVFCNPDSPQRPVREAVLRHGKILIMASPRLRRGFILLDPRRIPERSYSLAATIKGAFQFGEIRIDALPLVLPLVDLKVAGSVAVSPEGGRVGKGGGFSDLEYGILKELEAVSEDTPIATTVHDLQLVERVPMAKHDVPVDYVFTPSSMVKVQTPRKRPEGVYWGLLEEHEIEAIPLLKMLREKRGVNAR